MRIAASARCSCGILVLACLLVAETACADDLAVAVPVMQNFIELSEEQVTQWVFQNASSVHDARKKLESTLDLEVSLVGASTSLNDSQRTKLQVAGNGDIYRFFEEFEDFKRGTRFGSIDQNEYQKVWERLQPLQQRYSRGLFGRGSLFRKTARSTLDGEQLNTYQAAEVERNRLHYVASVKAVVALIETKVPLTVEQREKLLELVVTKTEPPKVRIEGYNKMYVVLVRLAKIPEDEIKPIFLDHEWKAIQSILQQGRNMGAHVRQLEQEAE